MKPKFLLLLICLLPVAVFAQDYRESFRALTNKGDNQATLNLLNTWRKAKPNDPELYVAFYNFYAREGLKEVLSLTKQKPDGDAFVLKDKDNKTAGYLGSGGSYNETYLKKGFAYIDTGISKFPDRLDMRFGKVYILGRIGNYAEFTNEIVKAIDYGESIKLKWAWADGKPLEDPQKFMLSTIQSYVNQLYNAGDGNAVYIKQIAETVLKYHPDDVENLSNLAITYIIKQDFSSALQPLLKAEKINPQDAVVLNNIAYCYSRTGNKPDAIKYYELVNKYGNDDEKKNAATRIEELKKAK